MDSWDETWLRAVRPHPWQNPEPRSTYHLVVLGAGTAGLVAAAGATALGARVALVEKHRLGGDCLNTGCVPSKSLLASSRSIKILREAQEQLGLTVGDPPHLDFGKVMGQLRRRRAHLSRHDSVERFRNLGVDVYFGTAQFEDARTVVVDGLRLRFRRAIIATGSRPAIPPLPGLDKVKFLTNETVFSLTELPRRLMILGAGPIGCELAQAFALLGSQVWLVESEHGVLPREERDAALVVEDALRNSGVKLLCCARQTQFTPLDTETSIMTDSHGTRHTFLVDQVLVATGRRPNIEQLALEAAGVSSQQNGILVNDFLQTTARHIYAAGDVCLPFRFTHVADYAARIALENALFWNRRRFDSRAIPWCTYTTPELAHVGLYPTQSDRDTEFRSFEYSYAELDRAVLDGEETGFVRVHVSSRSDQILGATVVGKNAGELIGLLALAIKRRIGLGQLANLVLPYPTMSEAIRRVADQYRRTQLTPLVRKLLRLWFR